MRQHDADRVVHGDAAEEKSVDDELALAGLNFFMFNTAVMIDLDSLRNDRILANVTCNKPEGGPHDER